LRLNPFVYLSETDTLFYSLILVGVVVPAFWALLFGFTTGVVYFGSSALLLLVLSVVVFASIPLLIYRHYKRSSERILKDSGLMPFKESLAPEYFGYIQGFYASLPHTFTAPTLMYSDDAGASPFSFGTGKKMYIAIGTGLLVTDDSEAFKTVFLHELGHIENKDVEKTSVAISTISSLKVFLPAVLLIFILSDIYIKTGVLYYGNLSGHSMSFLFPKMQFGLFFSWVGAVGLSFVILGSIVYMLRNQIVRVREFYADARAVEWQRSSSPLEKTLIKFKTLDSKFESLRRFHPSCEERIKVTLDNSKLFSINLWIILSVGLLYGFLLSEVPSLSIIYIYGNLNSSMPLFVALSTAMAFVLFALSMFAISSEFHKLILKEQISAKTGFFSKTVLLDIVKVTIAFCVGFNLGFVISDLGAVPAYSTQLSSWVTNEFESTFSLTTLVQAIHFAIILVVLWVFGSMLARRSFSRKAARINFLAVTLFASVFYNITNPTIGRMIFGTTNLWLASVVFIAIAAFVAVKLSDRGLRCPYCHDLVHSSLNLQECPNCEKPLYSWAVYDF